MFLKVLHKSGRKILKTIKKLSTSTRLLKKLEMENQESVPCSPIMYDPDTVSVCWSLKSLDARSVDTFVTYLAEGYEKCSSTCCYCYEFEENQRNENIENEML